MFISMLTKKEELYRFELKTLQNAVPYDVPQIGFGNDNVNNLRLWDVEIRRIWARLSDDRSSSPCAGYYSYSLSDDSSHGKELHLIQNTLWPVQVCRPLSNPTSKQGRPLKDIHEKVSVHINDTHPAVAPAEFYASFDGWIWSWMGWCLECNG